MNCNIFEITDGDFINKSDRLKNLFDAIENYSKETIPNVKPPPDTNVSASLVFACKY